MKALKAGAFDSLGAKRRQLLLVFPQVLDSIAAEKRNNLDGQLDMFGDSGTTVSIPLPDVEEFPLRELMIMEKEVTGLYLSGHPMDEYAGIAAKAGAVPIGRIKTSFDEENPSANNFDGETVTVAGIISSVKTKTTKNNSLMAYVTLEDNTGDIEMLVFQRILNEWGSDLREGVPVLARGRISARDEKTPQLMCEILGPIDKPLPAPSRRSEGYFNNNNNHSSVPAEKTESSGSTLWVRLSSMDCPEYQRLKLILIMFPGKQNLVLYFEDTKKRLGAKCVIHPALIAELREMLGEENVVVK